MIVTIGATELPCPVATKGLIVACWLLGEVLSRAVKAPSLIIIRDALFKIAAADALTRLPFANCGSGSDVYQRIQVLRSLSAPSGKEPQLTAMFLKNEWKPKVDARKAPIHVKFRSMILLVSSANPLNLSFSSPVDIPRRYRSNTTVPEIDATAKKRPTCFGAFIIVL